jgi:hypothetical protein
MANYVICRKKFVSLGTSQIEMADININNITVQSDNEKIDCTDFLKYGSAYDTIQSQYDLKSSVINENIIIEKDTIGTYFTYTNTNNNIILLDKLVLFGNNNKLIYCIVTDIITDKIYFEYHSELTIILDLRYTKIQIIRYNDINEYTVTYEMKLESSITKYPIPIFLPEMKQSLSAKKNILIHVKNSSENTSFIFLPKKYYYVNNLTRNSPFVLEYLKDNKAIQSEYTTFLLCLLFNGNNSWFFM